MSRSIVAIAVMFVAFLVGSQSLASNELTAANEGQYALKPNTRLAEKGNLKAFCFSPVDSVVHYIGANISENSRSAREIPGPVSLGSADTEAAWTVLLGAGVERQLSKRAAFDIDYRYISSPVEINFDTLQLPSGHEHHFSAGMKFYF